MLQTYTSNQCSCEVYSSYTLLFQDTEQTYFSLCCPPIRMPWMNIIPTQALKAVGYKRGCVKINTEMSTETFLISEFKTVSQIYLDITMIPMNITDIYTCHRYIYMSQISIHITDVYTCHKISLHVTYIYIYHKISIHVTDIYTCYRYPYMSQDIYTCPRYLYTCKHCA